MTSFKIKSTPLLIMFRTIQSSQTNTGILNSKSSKQTNRRVNSKIFWLRDRPEHTKAGLCSDYANDFVPCVTNKLFHWLMSFPLCKAKPVYFVLYPIIKNGSPTKTMSLFMRLLEEQKHESLIILFTSMTPLLSFFSVLSLGHKFLRARTIFYYVQKLQ